MYKQPSNYKHCGHRRRDAVSFQHWLNERCGRTWRQNVRVLGGLADFCPQLTLNCAEYGSFECNANDT